MDHVRIAELKAGLSAHLRSVRRGNSLTVMDRDTPVARIVPFEDDAASLRVRPPLPGADLHRVRLPPRLRLRGDVVALLLKERQGDR